MTKVKGYYLPYGYMGFVGDLVRCSRDGYILFATEEDYLDWIDENTKEDTK